MLITLALAGTVPSTQYDGPSEGGISPPQNDSQADRRFAGVVEVLVTDRRQLLRASGGDRVIEIAATRRCRSIDHPILASGWGTSPPNPLTVIATDLRPREPRLASAANPQEIDPLYLFGCFVDWEKREEPTAAWELLAAAQSGCTESRAHARCLLTNSHYLGAGGAAAALPSPAKQKRNHDGESEMKTPYGLNIVEDCTNCPLHRPGFFCDFSHSILHSLNQFSHKSTFPAGAVLFVEGQTPRGMFVLCSGKVNLSTTSREGKILILKTAEAGEALGLSAAVSGQGYETTAETATPCQLNFVDRKHLLELMQAHSEIGLHASQSLSRDFHSAYRDIHDLVLTRSSAGKLAKLLLSQSTRPELTVGAARVNSSMTHEEMAQRIGSSRETVTRLLSDLRRRRLIHLDGPTLVIHDRTALEAMAI